MLESGRGGPGERATTVHINKQNMFTAYAISVSFSQGWSVARVRGGGGGVERAEGRGQLLEVVVGRGGRCGRWHIKLVLTRKRV